MAKKKHYENRETKNQSRDNDGLKQRRLKDESRWRFNPNQDYSQEEGDNEDEEFIDEENWERN